jgi:hypothetical protein
MFHRKFWTGPAIWPFSMRKSPSRVIPVFSSVWVSTPRMYQKNVTSSPRRVDLTISSMDMLVPSMTRLLLSVAGVGSFFCRLAYWRL